MHMPQMAAILAAALLILSGCSKSDLDRCIDSQMAVWKQQHQEYEEALKNYTPPPPHDDNAVLNVGSVKIDPSLLPPLIGDSRTKEEAEAQANLQCGRIYAKRR